LVSNLSDKPAVIIYEKPRWQNYHYTNYSKEIKVEIINAILNEVKISRDEWIELVRSLVIF